MVLSTAWEDNGIIISVLQMRKPRVKEVKKWDLPGHLSSNARAKNHWVPVLIYC